MTLERTLRAPTPEATRGIAAHLARVVRAHAAITAARERAALAQCASPPPGSPRHKEPGGLFVGLGGDLGAGKTTFVQGFAGELAGEEDLYVTSPTFAIAQPYPCSPPVLHMDLYRISTLEELEAIGYREAYFAEGVTLVEWFDRVPEALPPDRLEIHLSAEPSGERELRLRARGGRAEAILEELASSPSLRCGYGPSLAGGSLRASLAVAR